MLIGARNQEVVLGLAGLIVKWTGKYSAFHHKIYFSFWTHLDIRFYGLLQDRTYTNLNYVYICAWKQEVVLGKYLYGSVDLRKYHISSKNLFCFGSVLIFATTACPRMEPIQTKIISI